MADSETHLQKITLRSAKYLFNHAYVLFSCILDANPTPTNVAGTHPMPQEADEQSMHRFLENINDDMPPDSWSMVFLLGNHEGTQYLFTHPRIRIKTVNRILEDVGEAYPCLVNASLSGLPIYPQQITDNIFLGGSGCDDVRVYKNLGISCVVNMTRSARTELPNPNKEHFLYVNVEDDDNQDMTQAWDQGLAFLEAALARGDKILVHCQRGVSRSGSLVIAHIMRTEKMTYANALEFVREQRPIVRPNRGFVRQLEEYMK
jgi:hypothetical protein